MDEFTERVADDSGGIGHRCVILDSGHRHKGFLS
jgi:hypothetical protein